MDTKRLQHFVDSFWDDSILPSITEYIRIPNKSPSFDPQWVEHGYMEEAVTLMEAWARQQLAAFPGATLEVFRLPGRTPLLLMDLPGDSDDTVLLYGHLDKQPEMTGGSEGRGPWTPVLAGDRLYGRGGADDGQRGEGQRKPPSLKAQDKLACGNAHETLQSLASLSEQSEGALNAETVLKSAL